MSHNRSAASGYYEYFAYRHYPLRLPRGSSTARIRAAIEAARAVPDPR
jgi:hypothetical protein